MSDFPWDDFAGDRMQFQQVGDNIKGRVKALRVETGKQGDKFPVVSLQVDAEGNQKEVWAGTTDLKTQLAALKPDVGWWLDITFSGERHTGQASPMKLFTINAKPPKPAGIAEAREALAPTPAVGTAENHTIRPAAESEWSESRPSVDDMGGDPQFTPDDGTF